MLDKYYRISEAVKLLDMMAHFRMEADTIACSAVISACEKSGEWQKAFELLSAVFVDDNRDYCPRKIIAITIREQ